MKSNVDSTIRRINKATTLPLLFDLGIIYKKNKTVSEVRERFEYSIDLGQ